MVPPKRSNREQKEGYMFGKLSDLTGTKSLSDALGFYIFHVVFLVGFSTVLGIVLGKVGVTGITGSVLDGGTVHTIIGTLFVLFLSSLILTGKKMTGDGLAIILTVVGVIISYHVSVILGLLVVSYLTTLHGKE